MNLIDGVAVVLRNIKRWMREAPTDSVQHMVPERPMSLSKPKPKTTVPESPSGGHGLRRSPDKTPCLLVRSQIPKWNDWLSGCVDLKHLETPLLSKKFSIDRWPVAGDE